MRETTIGNGPVKAAIVGGIHGDEPAGVSAVDRVVSDPPDLSGSVKCIVANERAINRGTRYIEQDLNRVFPGKKDSNVHEVALAYEIVAATEGLPTLSLHSTQSTSEPFAIANGKNSEALATACDLPVNHVVDDQRYPGTFTVEANVIDVECGFQKSEEAKENAYELSLAFLRVLGLLDGNVKSTDPDVYRMNGKIDKDDEKHYTLLVDNFKSVEKGEPIARATDGTEVIAPYSFIPVLMSAAGYEGMFGYTADLVDEDELPS